MTPCDFGASGFRGLEFDRALPATGAASSFAVSRRRGIEARELLGAIVILGGVRFGKMICTQVKWQHLLTWEISYGRCAAPLHAACRSPENPCQAL